MCVEGNEGKDSARLKGKRFRGVLRTQALLGTNHAKVVRTLPPPESAVGPPDVELRRAAAATEAAREGEEHRRGSKRGGSQLQLRRQPQRERHELRSHPLSPSLYVLRHFILLLPFFIIILRTTSIRGEAVHDQLSVKAEVILHHGPLCPHVHTNLRQSKSCSRQKAYSTSPAPTRPCRISRRTPHFPISASGPKLSLLYVDITGAATARIPRTSSFRTNLKRRRASAVPASQVSPGVSSASTFSDAEGTPGFVRYLRHLVRDNLSSRSG